MPVDGAQPAGQRRRRHRRGHGHQDPAPQPGRGLRRPGRPAGQPGHRAARTCWSTCRARTSPPAASSTAGAGIYDYVTTGRGRVVVRARTEIEVQDNGTRQIIVTELPYQVNKATLIEKIANLVRGGHHRGHQRPARRERPRRHAHRHRAEEGRLSPGGAEQALHPHLHADDLRRDQPGAGEQPAPGDVPEGDHAGVPRRSARRSWSGARSTTCARPRSGPTSSRATASRWTTSTRSSSSSRPASRPTRRATGLMERFGLSEIQAQAILDLRLARLTGLERQKIEDEYRDADRAHRRAEGDPGQPRPGAADHPRRDRARCARRYGDDRRTDHRRGRGRDRHRGPDRRRAHGGDHQQPGLRQAHPPGHLPPAGPRRQGHHRHGHQGRGLRRQPLHRLDPPVPAGADREGPALLAEGAPRAQGRPHRQGPAHREPDPDPARRQDPRRGAGARVQRGPLPGLRHQPGHHQAHAADGLLATAPGRHPRHQPARGRAPGGRARDRRRPATSSWPAAAAWPSASTRPTPAPWAAPPAACAGIALGSKAEGRSAWWWCDGETTTRPAGDHRERLRQAHAAGRVPHPAARRQGPDHHQVQRAQRPADGDPRRARRARS